MSVFKHPVHLPEPNLSPIYSGTVVFDEDIENFELKPGEMHAFKVKSGSTSGKVNAEIVPVVSVLWKTKRLDGGVKYESKIVGKVGKLATISTDVYGNNSKMLNILYNTGWPRSTWLAHTIKFIRVDKVEGATVNFTCYQVD